MNENKACQALVQGLAQSQYKHSILLTIIITKQPGMEEHYIRRPEIQDVGTSDINY